MPTGPVRRRCIRWRPDRIPLGRHNFAVTDPHRRKPAGDDRHGARHDSFRRNRAGADARRLPAAVRHHPRLHRHHQPGLAIIGPHRRRRRVRRGTGPLPAIATAQRVDRRALRSFGLCRGRPASRRWARRPHPHRDHRDPAGGQPADASPGCGHAFSPRAASRRPPISSATGSTSPPSRKPGRCAGRANFGCAVSRSSPTCSPRPASACCGRCRVIRRRYAFRCAATPFTT